jgi:hypothetical protein
VIPAKAGNHQATAWTRAVSAPDYLLVSKPIELIIGNSHSLKLGLAQLRLLELGVQNDMTFGTHESPAKTGP